MSVKAGFGGCFAVSHKIRVYCVEHDGFGETTTEFIFIINLFFS